MPAEDDSRPYLSLDNIAGEVGRIEGWECAGDYRSQSVELSPGDVAYARLRPYLNKVAMVDRAALGSAELIVLPPSDALVPEFLRHQLSSSRFVKFAQEESTGDRPRLKWRQMRHYAFAVPSLAEQRRIVAAIEEHFSRLDAVESSLVDTRRRLDVLRGITMDRAFYDAEAERAVKIGDLAEVSGGIQKQPKRRPRQNRYPFLRVANVGRGQLDLAEVHEVELFEGEIARFRLEQGDLLVVEGNGSVNQIGRAALWGGEVDDCVHQNHLIRVRPGDELLPEYLALCWNAPRTANQVRAVASSTSGLYTLSTSKVKSVGIPVVPLSDQRRIVDQLGILLNGIEQARAAAVNAQSRALTLRRSILSQAFSGQLMSQVLDVA
ncbi:restriction endonuclease subunit S [Candidatus Poriferisodalis multihospitum]|uniref:restriction endonuclease subunit S n=1 Tax=Candidatus Poriferisodalis multihospitum TaxID=2983191 RepID=UPI002B25C07C|nr:restriction endonuclease subunit S [Candidatus Poriferisodalis multihospitum]